MPKIILNPKQHEFFSRAFSLMRTPSTERSLHTAIFCGGVGAGKTFVLALLMIEASRISKKNILCGLTHTTLLETIEQLKKCWDMAGAKWYWETKIGRANPCLVVEGARWIIRTLENPDAIVAVEGGVVALDEFADAPVEGYMNAVQRCRSIEPQLRIGTTTPKQGWFVEKFQSPPENVFLVQGASSALNRHTGRAYIDVLNQTFTGAHAQQEIGGYIVSMSGGIYNPVWTDAVVIPGIPWRLCIDFGHHRPAMLGIQTQGDHDLVFMQHLPERKTIHDVLFWVDEYQKKMGIGPPCIISCDPAGNQHHGVEYFTEVQVVKNFFNNSKVQFTCDVRLRNVERSTSMLAAAVEHGKYVFSNSLKKKSAQDAYTIYQSFASMAWDEKNPGRPAEDDTDHPIDALRYDFINVYGFGLLQKMKEVRK